MISVEEARKLSTLGAEKAWEEELEQIDKLVKERARKGKFCLNMDSISSIAIKKLEELGYRVEMNYRMEYGFDYTIYWREKKEESKPRYWFFGRG